MWECKAIRFHPVAEKDLVRARLEHTIDALPVVGTDHSPQSECRPTERVARGTSAPPKKT